MIIKCPHCRFKYEDEVAPGIQELSCVCPRCAYPFTVQLTDSPHLSSDDAQASGTNVVQEKGTFVGDMSDNASANVPPMTYPQTPSPSPRPAYPYATNSPRPRNTGCCLKLLIILIIAIGGIVLLGRSCYQSFTADDLEQTKGEFLNDVDDSRNDEYANDGTPKNLPKWVQGQWSYRDENGFTISVSIHGRTISEASGGGTSYGTITYEYENGIITAHYSDGHDMRYKVYKDEQVIDAGSSNLRMKKIE